MDTKEDLETFEKIVEPVIKYLNTLGCPHYKVIIDIDSAELLVGDMCHVTDKYVKD